MRDDERDRARKTHAILLEIKYGLEDWYWFMKEYGAGDGRDADQDNLRKLIKIVLKVGTSNFDYWR